MVDESPTECPRKALIFFHEEYCGRSPMPLIISSFGNDPEFRAFGRSVRAEDAASIDHRLVIEMPIRLTNFTPIHPGMAGNEI